MRSQVPFLVCGATLAATLFLAAEPGSTATPADAANLNAPLAELEKQQVAIAANQAQIDTQLAALAEQLRVARIYVSRGGSK